MPENSKLRPKKKLPSQRSRGLVDRAMHLHLGARTWIYHGPNAWKAQAKLKSRALNARRLLLERIAELEALAHARIGSHG